MKPSVSACWWSRCPLVFALFLFAAPAAWTQGKPVPAAPADNFFASIIQVSGKVGVTRGMMEIEEVTTEEKLQFDDEIATGADGRLQISFGSSFASIGPDTVIAINKRNEGGVEVVSIALQEGRFRSKIFKEAGKAYEVSSPSGTAKAIGTDFVTGFNPKQQGQFSVVVIEGRVGMDAIKETAGGRGGNFAPDILKVNESCSSNDKGRVTPVVTLPQDTIEQIKRDLPLPEVAGGQQVSDKRKPPESGGKEDAFLGVKPEPVRIDVNAPLPPMPDPAAIVAAVSFQPAEMALENVVQNHTATQAAAILQHMQTDAVKDLTSKGNDRITLRLQFQLQVD